MINNLYCKINVYAIENYKWFILILQIMSAILLNVLFNGSFVYCDDRSLYEQMNGPDRVLGSDGIWRRYYPDGSVDLTFRPHHMQYCGVKFYETPDGLLVHNDGYMDEYTGYRASNDNYSDINNDDSSDSSDTSYSSYSSDLDDSTNPYLSEDPVLRPEPMLPNPQKLYDDFLIIINNAKNSPDYYKQYFDYISAHMPESVWSTTVEELKSEGNTVANYIDSLNENIKCDTFDQVFDFIQLKATLVAYNALNLEDNLDNNNLCEKIFIHCIEAFAEPYKNF